MLEQLAHWCLVSVDCEPTEACASSLIYQVAILHLVFVGQCRWLINSTRKEKYNK